MTHTCVVRPTVSHNIELLLIVDFFFFNSDASRGSDIYS